MFASAVTTIILDLDGPVLDGFEKHYHCYRDILADYGLTPLQKAVYIENKRERMPTIDQLKLSNAENCYDFFLSDWQARIEQKKYLELDSIQPGALDIISRWHGAGVNVVLTTMRHNEENLHWQLDHLGLLQFFTRIIVVNGLKYTGINAKSAAVSSLVSADWLSHALWIGDTEMDIDSAKLLGLPVCAITSGLRSQEFLAALEPDYIEDSLYSFSKKPSILHGH